MTCVKYTGPSLWSLTPENFALATKASPPMQLTDLARTGSHQG